MLECVADHCYVLVYEAVPLSNYSNRNSSWAMGKFVAEKCTTSCLWSDRQRTVIKFINIFALSSKTMTDGSHFRCFSSWLTNLYIIGDADSNDVVIIWFQFSILFRLFYVIVT